jgi:hypothetical protein
MRRIFVLALFFASSSWALECKAPAHLVQAEGKNQTLFSWCEADGVKNGPFEQFSVKDGLQVRANYASGKLDGEFKRFFPGGQVEVEGTYKDGQMTGRWTRYNENGKKRDQGEWLNENPTGHWAFYDAHEEQTREITYDGQGKVVTTAEAKPRELRTSDFWRLRLGLAHAQGGDGGGHAEGPIAGVDLHLFDLGRWFRSELSARVLPEFIHNDNNSNTTPNTNTNTNNNGHSGYSGQATLDFEPFTGWLDPFAFTFRLGPHFSGFDKANLYLGLGLRYQWRTREKGFHMPGAFVEFGGLDDNHDNGGGNNNCGPGPGSCNNNNNNNHGGGNIAAVGLLFTI